MTKSLSRVSRIVSWPRTHESTIFQGIVLQKQWVLDEDMAQFLNRPNVFRADEEST